MDFRQLEMFASVADRMSFTAAAEELHVAQSAISRKIRLLEEELGEPLFKRSAKKIFITEAGRILRVHAERVFRSLRDAAQEVSELSELQRGGLSVGSGVTAVTYILPPILERFRALHPKIEISVVTGTAEALLAQIRSGGLDLGLITLPVTAPDLDVIPFASEEMVLITSVSHPHLGQRKSITPAELAGLPLICFQRGTTTRLLLDQYFQRHGVSPTIVMESESVSLIKPLVQIDFGVSIVPRRAIMAEAKRGELHHLKLAGAPLERQIGLVYQRSAYQPRAMRAFIALALQARAKA